MIAKQTEKKIEWNKGTIDVELKTGLLFHPMNRTNQKRPKKKIRKKTQNCWSKYGRFHDKGKKRKIFNVIDFQHCVWWTTTDGMKSSRVMSCIYFDRLKKNEHRRRNEKKIKRQTHEHDDIANQATVHNVTMVTSTSKTMLADDEVTKKRFQFVFANISSLYVLISRRCQK